LSRVQDDQVSSSNTQGESRPFLAPFTKKMLKVTNRDSADVVRMPDGHLVVLGNSNR
jgi:hypothetical protein